MVLPPQTLCRSVSERLTFIHDKLLAMDAKGTLPREDLIVRYSGLVDSYKVFLEKHNSRVWVYRVVTSKHVLQKVGGFRDDIVTLMQALQLCHIEAMADERVKMQAFREEQERLILRRFTDDATIVAEVSREEQQVKALSVLVHELKASSAAAGAGAAGDDDMGSGSGSSAGAGAKQGKDEASGVTSNTSSSNSTTVESNSTTVESNSTNTVESASTNDSAFTDRKVLATALNKVMRQSRVRVNAVPDWFLAPHNVEYEPCAFAGGSFGLVHHGRMNFMDVVVKCLRIDMRSNAVMTGRFREEASLWFGFRHRHVLMIYGACDVSSSPFIVCEYATRGNLADYLSVERNRDVTVRLLCEEASGLAYLHSHRVVHADLKCDNILVASDGSAKIADFSFSYVRTLSASKRSVLVGGDVVGGAGTSSSAMATTAKKAGAMRWRAPECLSGCSPTFASDVFSLGMSVIEAVTHDVPWGHFVDDGAVWHLVTSGKLPEKPARMSDRMWRLVERMCRFQAEERPSLESVVSTLGAMSAADVGVVADVAGVGVGADVADVGVVADVGSEVDGEMDTVAAEINARQSVAATKSVESVGGHNVSSHTSHAQGKSAVTSTANDASNMSGTSMLITNAAQVHSNDPPARSHRNTSPIPLAPDDFRARLVAACHSNDVNAARDILQSHPEVLRDGRSANKRDSPLLVASKHGHVEMVQLLLKLGADVTASDDTGWTSLHHAAFNGHADVLSTLLGSNANVNALDNESATPLHAAAKNGHAALALELIKNGAKVKGAAKDGKTALHVAALHGHVDVVRGLIKHKADVNARDKDGWTPLYFGVQKGHAAVASELIKCGAKANAATKFDSVTPLHEAAQNSHVHAVALLIKHKADVNAADIRGWAALYVAAEKGHTAVVCELIKCGAKVNAVSMNAHYALVTPPQTAVYHGHLDTVVELLKHKANVNATTRNGDTPLDLAAMNGHTAVVSELIKCGADVKAVKKEHLSTTLHMAAENGHVDTVVEPLRHKVDVNAINTTGDTPLDLAAEKGHTAVGKGRNSTLRR